MNSFAIEIGQAFPFDIALQQAAQNVLSRLEISVIDKRVQSGKSPISGDAWEWKNYGGLGIYLPLGYDEERRKFYKQEEVIWLGHQNSWDEFLNDYLPSLE